MYWRLRLAETADAKPLSHIDGRFVLHRHHDADGPHLDLRIEMDGYLIGWRIDGLSLEGEPWATEKAPHALRWLDRDAEAEWVDGGVYMLEREPGTGTRTLWLKGRSGVVQLTVERVGSLAPSVVREVVDMLRENDVPAADAPRLLRDGLAARRRAVERLCGLGRELDGNAFDTTSWRTLLGGLSLDEIHAQLRAFEVRFDQKYPPSAVSRPERLEEEPGRTVAALSIARE